MIVKKDVVHVDIVILKLTVAELNLMQYIQISVSDKDLYFCPISNLLSFSL